MAGTDDHALLLLLDGAAAGCEDVPPSTCSAYASSMNRISRSECAAPQKQSESKQLETDSDGFMSGHSLGGSTAYYSVMSNKLIGDRIKRLDTYNLGRSPFQSIKVSEKRRKMLAAKITHHRTKGDVVSASAMVNRPEGRIKSYPPKSTKASKAKSLAAKAAGFGMTYAALHNHTLEHFK